MITLDTLIGYVSRFFMILAAIALLLLVFLATANVLLRLFHVPFAGTYEIVSFLGALVTAGALGHTQRRKDHIKVDIITSRYFPRMKRMIDAVSYSLSALLFSIAAWQIFKWGEKIRLSGELSETLQIKFHPFIYGVAAGFTLLTLVLLLDTARAILYKREDEL